MRDNNEENIKRAQSMIDDIDVYMKSFSAQRFCNNNLVNVIAANKLHTLEAAGADVQLSLIVDDNIAVADVDLCRIFTNLFDNAVNALNKLEDGRDRTFTLKCAQQDGSLIIRSENPCNADSVQESKHNNKAETGHGYGLEILRSTAQKYNGQLVTEQANGNFIVTVSMHI